MCVNMRACVRACMRVCVCACVRACAKNYANYLITVVIPLSNLYTGSMSSYGCV